MDKIKKGFKDGTISSDGTSSTSKTNESKLSSKAQEFLKNLRKQYGDYDFFVGKSTDNLKAMVKGGNKEFSVVFSNAELERMVSDEKYAKEKMRCVERAVKMSDEINKEYTKHTDVQANSMEELIKKISSIDWSAVKPENVKENGGKFDLSI